MFSKIIEKCMICYCWSMFENARVEDAGLITVPYTHKSKNGIVATLDHRMEYSVGYRII